MNQQIVIISDFYPFNIFILAPLNLFNFLQIFDNNFEKLGIPFLISCEEYSLIILHYGNIVNALLSKGDLFDFVTFFRNCKQVKFIGEHHKFSIWRYGKIFYLICKLFFNLKIINKILFNVNIYLSNFSILWIVFPDFIKFFKDNSIILFCNADVPN